MALTRNFRETVQADIKRDPVFRAGILSDALEGLLCGDLPLAKELLRDYINATVGFPALAANTGIHVKTLHQMFGAKGNPTATKLFAIIAYLQNAEGVRFKVRPVRVALRAKRRTSARRRTRSFSRHSGSKVSAD